MSEKKNLYTSPQLHFVLLTPSAAANSILKLTCIVELYRHHQTTSWQPLDKAAFTLFELTELGRTLPLQNVFVWALESGFQWFIIYLLR